MTKKIFVQPELTVVSIHSNDIVTASPDQTYGVVSTRDALAPDRFDTWYEGD